MRIKYFLVFLPILIFTSLSYVFAEGDTTCNGLVIGKNQDQINIGEVDHDAHPGLYANSAMDLNVWNSMPGYLPNERIDAACISEEGGITESGFEYEYLVNGFAGATNLGWILYNCQGGGLCGDYDYQVVIGEADELGVRRLSGYAFSPVVWWLDFSGVTLRNGALSGDITTSAGLSIPTEGIKMILPGEDLELASTGEFYCEDKKGVCIELHPDSYSYTAKADGDEGYYLHLWVRSDDGQELLGYDLSSFLESIEVNFKNNLQKDQVSGADSSTATSVLPTRIEDFVDCNDEGISEELSSECGDYDSVHYVSAGPITSVAPTTETNLSKMFSVDPSYDVKNHLINTNNLDVELEESNLILEFATYDAYNGLIRESQSHANGRVNSYINFEDIISIDAYVHRGSLEDTFQAYPGVVENIKVLFNDMSGGVAGFTNKSLLLNLGAEDHCTFVFTDGNLASEENNVGSLDTDFDRQVLLTAEGEDACKPYLSSIVSYETPLGEVKYFSTGIPKLPQAEAVDTGIFISGNIVGQKVLDSRYVNNWHGYTDVNISTERNIITRNIDKFLELDLLIDAEGKDCTISQLSSDSGTGDALFTVSGCVKGVDYDYFFVVGQHILYFYNANVDFTEINYSSTWTVIVNNGNLNIKGNIMPSLEGSNLSLISVRDGSDRSVGNVYIAPCDIASVNHIEASIFADGYITTGKSFVDGLPVWSNALERRSSLKCPLYMKGSLLGSFTVGGSTLLNPVSGTGEEYQAPVDPDVQQDIEATDLNFLRLYSPVLQFSDYSSCPIDMLCGQALCDEEVMAIANGSVIYGELEDEGGELIACDGINSQKVYATDEDVKEFKLNEEYFGLDGDLTSDPSIIPEALDLQFLYHPVYIDYAESMSLIFQSS